MFASCSHGLRLRWPVDIYSKGKNASTRECNDDFIELEVNIAAPIHFGLFVPLNQAKKGVSELVGVTDPGHQEERGLVTLQWRCEEEYVWNREDPLGILLVIKVNGKLQQPNRGKTSTGPEPSRMKVWTHFTLQRTMTN